MKGSVLKRALVGFLSIIPLVISVTPAIAYEKEIESLCSSLGSQIGSSGKKTIAVVDFTDLQGAVTELGRFLAEEISVNLAMGAKGYQVIDRAHLKRLLQEHKLATTDIIDPKTAKQLVSFKSVYMVIYLNKTRSQSMVAVAKPKPIERDRDGTRNYYSTSVQTCNW